MDHVELDIKEMLELGKKAAITRKTSSNNVIEPEVISMGSRYVSPVGNMCTPRSSFITMLS